jgi:hypothetical protein
MTHLEVKPASRSNRLIWPIISIWVAATAFVFWNQYGEGKMMASHTYTTKTAIGSAKVTTHTTKKKNNRPFNIQTLWQQMKE